MRRCRSLALVLTSLLLSLFLFTVAVAQDEPPVFPTDEPTPATGPSAMEFQPPPDADSLEDFVPPGLTLEHIPAAYQQRVAVPFAGQDGKAVSFGNGQVALIIEGGAFPAQSEIQFTALPVPVDRGAAGDTTTPGPLVTAEPVTATPTATVPLTMTPTAESVAPTATATLASAPPATPTTAPETPVATPVTTTATLTPPLPSPTSTVTAEAPPATAAITATNTLTNPVESSDLVRFQLDVVDSTTGESSPLARPARIVVDLRPLTQGLNAIYNRFYLAYQDVEDPLVWHEVPIQVHQADGLISAEVFHFSHWAAGVRPERWNPSWTPPAVSTFSGAATYSYPIQAPPGRKGLQPSVLLSYSSRALDGHIKDSEPGDVAHGWSLAQISVVRENVKMRFSGSLPQTYHPDRFRLVLDGAGYELHRENNPVEPIVRYYAKDLPGFLIQRYYDPAAPNKEGLYWIVKSPEGVHYRLGYLGNAHHSEEWQEAADYHVAIDGHQGKPDVGGTRASGIAWHVDTVTDPFGNQMTYHYNSKTDSESIEWWNVNHWTSFTLKTISSRLDAIRYNYPTRVTALPPAATVAPLASAPGTVILFRDQSAAVETDPITNIYIFHAGNTTTPIMEYRLTPAALFVDSPSCMNYDTVPAIPRRTNTRVITAIQQFAATDANPLTSDAGYALPKTEFSYSYKAHFTKNGGPCFQFYYLSGFKNGYGGEVAFTYGADNRSHGDYIHYTYNHYEWPQIGYSYFVSQMTSYDGRNPATKVGYAYYRPCYSQTDGYVGAMPDAARCVSPGAPEFGPIVGFERTTQTFRGYANEALNTRYNQKLWIG